MISKENIIVTGSEGLLGRILVKKLVEYDLIKLDLCDTNGENYVRADISDYGELTKALKPHLERSKSPIKSVVHLAADSNVNANWESVLRNNIIATRNVFEFARENSIRRIVFASSNHVTGRYEGDPPSLHMMESPKVVSPEMPVRPDGYYATSKLFGESLGRYFAERHEVSVICLRIGSVLEANNPASDKRFRSTWLSHDDLVQLIRKSLKADVTFGIYYGVSNNSRRFWDISNATLELDYEPCDNAEAYF